jgi:hypothetical protein
MTAHSETFCDEEVRDAAKTIFEELIPEYDRIEIPRNWKDIWSDEGYPDSGTIQYLDENGKVVAILHFVTKFHVEDDGDSKYFRAEPSQLVLEFPDGRRYCEKHSLIDELKEIKDAVRELRDDQEAVPCLDENECICNAFDRVMDDIDDVIKRAGDPKQMIEQR